jgi:hypothetical protein
MTPLDVFLIFLSTGSVDVYDVSADDHIFTPVWSTHSHDDVCTSLAVNADQTWLISACYDGW